MLIHDDSKRPVTVYHVEDLYGIGPYRSDLRYRRPAPRALGMTVAEASRGRNATRRCPDPREDFDDHDRRDFVGERQFGFERKEDAARWFGARNLRALCLLGFSLRVIKAARVWRSISGRQVIFERCDGKKFDLCHYADLEP